MGKISIAFGVALMGLGVGVFAMSTKQSPTAFIPSGFGLLFVVFGALETARMREELQRQLTALIGMIGMLSGLIMGIRGWLRLAEGDSALAVQAQVAMGTLCLVMMVCRGPMRSWLDFAKILAFLTKPLRVAVTFILLSVMYWLMLPFWALFLGRTDPLGKKLRPEAESYFEPYKVREATLESLSHAS